jgi:hypothetical protein
MGTTQMGKSPAMPPPIWKKPSGEPGVVARVPVGQLHHVFDAGAHHVDMLHTAPQTVGGEDVARGAVLPAGHEHRQIFLAGGDQPTVGRVDLIGCLQLAAAQDAVEKLVGKVAAPLGLGAPPLVQDHVLQPAKGLLLRDAGVRDAVQVLVEQTLLLRGRQVAPVRDAAVVVVGDEIVEIFLQIRPRAADAVDAAAADHLGQRESQFRRAHGPGHREKHAPARVEQLPPAPRRIEQGGGIEVAVVALDKPGDVS